MDKIYSRLLYGFFKCISFLPLGILFIISDIVVYPFVYHIAGYRLKVVRKNLKNSFPDMSDKALKKIEKRFYHHFCDYFFEAVRVLSMSEKEALQRMKFVNPEVVTNCSKRGQGVLLLLGHYGNWEFQSFLFLHMLEKGNHEGFCVYLPLSNKAFDHLYFKIRTRFKMNVVTKKGIYRTVIRLRHEGIAGVFGLLSDQSPSRADLNYWTNFLNQDTAIITGFERMAKQADLVVVYADVCKLSRGHYQTEYFMISDNPRNTASNEITEQYARLIEKTILKDPAYWLWTHKRWKHKHIDAETIE